MELRVMTYQTASKCFFAAAFAVALSALPGTAVLAQPGGNHSGGMGMGGMSGMHGDFGGQSVGHVSSQGIQNSNGPNGSDRDFGFDRAQDRMNTQGLQHNNVQDQPNDEQSQMPQSQSHGQGESHHSR